MSDLLMMDLYLFVWRTLESVFKIAIRYTSIIKILHFPLYLYTVMTDPVEIV